MEQFIHLDEHYECSVLLSDDGSMLISGGGCSIELNNEQAMKLCNLLLAYSRKEMGYDIRAFAFDLPEMKGA